MKTIGLGYDLATLHVAAVVGADMIPFVAAIYFDISMQNIEISK